jgi:tellurite resistance protein
MRIPPNLFGIAFGLTGLSVIWSAAQALLGVPAAVSYSMAVFAAVVWLLLMLAYLAQGRGQIAADLRDPVLSPFISGAVIAPLILSTRLGAVAPAAGRVLVCVFLALTVLIGGLITAQWIVGDTPQSAAHPGYLIPTAVGGLVGAYAAAAVQLRAIGAVAFGIGLICWGLVGSTVLGRLFFRALPPAALVPTLAIEILPPAMAGNAWFQLTGGAVNVVSYAIGGYLILMAVVQLCLVPVYRRLRFGPGFWVFTFCYAATVINALAWLRITRPAGTDAMAIVLVTLITLLMAIVAARTIVELARGQFLPAPANCGTPSTAAHEIHAVREAGLAHRPHRDPAGAVVPREVGLREAHKDVAGRQLQDEPGAELADHAEHVPPAHGP